MSNLFPVNLPENYIGSIHLDGPQVAAMKFISGNSDLLPSGSGTPKAVAILIEMGFVHERGKVIGIEGESQSVFVLTPTGEVWLSKQVGV